MNIKSSPCSLQYIALSIYLSNWRNDFFLWEKEKRKSTSSALETLKALVFFSRRYKQMTSQGGPPCVEPL